MENNMITEDYVSFETAKLLKEKGFDEKCSSVWRFTYNSPNGKGKWILYNYSMADENSIWNPTLQMAMKWLREVHNIAIETEWEHLWYAYIKPMTSKPFEEDCYQCGSSKYEEACETAIRYSLENLI